MKNFFRDLFRGQPNAKIISGYDPYLDLTTFSIGNEPVRLVRYNCGNSFIKSAQAEPFSYEFRLNNLGGDIVIAYTITEGSATITASFDGEDHVASNVTGSGTLTFERSSLVDNIVTVTVTPIGGAVSYMITNTCPIGSALTIVSLVLSDSDDTGLTMTDRYKWNGSPFASTSEFFTTGPVTRFQSVTGVEGVGTFPANGALMTIQAFKDTINSGHFALSECNRLGYLITDTVYNSTQYQDILDHPDTVFLTVTSTGEAGFTETNSAQFLFNRTEADQRLYLIWDYTSRNPIVSDDSANVTQGGTVIIDVLDNDEVEAGAVVTIATQPQHGSASVNGDMEVVYEHDGSENFNDSFTYTVTEGGCSSTATITISIGVTCGGTLTASGGTGIYNAQINFGTDTGWCGIQFNALNVPDRFQLIWDGVVVADSKYVGDNLNPGPPVSYTPTLLNTFNLSVFEYNGSGFTDTGIDEEITIVQDDISNNTTEATDGNGFLVFNKTTPTPTTVILRAVGPVGGTAWDLNDVICPTNDVIEGIAFFAYGFFTEANKAHVTKSKMLWRGSAPDKFYTNRFGDTNFSMYGDFATAKFINDGTNWYELDTNGNIVTQGAL
ncbi:MAG TPA: Ig-like domain-containing protein [Anaerovoracaceae bacterium]|nr:Ig-like domain-containing protein [Anaerovoracaceae bacterium]